MFIYKRLINILHYLFVSISILCIPIILQELYIQQIFPKYYYLSFLEMNDSTTSLLYIGVLNIILYFSAMTSQFNLREIFFILYFFICLLPSQIFIFGSVISYEIKLYYLLLLYIYPLVNFLIPRFHLKSINILEIKYYMLFVTLLASFILFYKVRPTLNIFALTAFVDLYEVRYSSRSSISSASVIYGYLYMLILKLLCPILLSYGLVYRSQIAIIVSLSIFVLGFFTSAHKSILLTPFIIFTFYIIISRKLHLFRLVPYTLLTTGLIALFANGVVSLITGEVLLRRVILMPGMLNLIYFEFFQASGFENFAKLSSKFFGTKDATNLSYIIGEQYFGRAEMSANANFVASGFGEAGIVGIILFSVIIV